MLSDHFQNGVETAKLMWSRIPATADEEDGEVGPSVKANGSSVVESLDYEVVENYAYREEQAKRGKLYMGYSVAVKWFLALLIGIGTGLAAVFINLSVENFAGWKFSLTFQIIQKSYFAGCLVYILFNLVLVLSSVYIITHFAPSAAGSGIPEIKGYLNGIDTRNPSFQNFNWKDFWEHRFSGRWSCTWQRRAACTRWSLCCFFAWTRWIDKISLAVKVVPNL